MAMILLVEDEIFIRQYAEWTIRDLGHDILCAADVEEAMAHLSASTQIRSLFVDIRLQSRAHGGYEVADHAIKHRPMLKVLYTSGSPLTAEMSDRFVRGGRFLRKPYTAAQLEHAIGATLN